MHMASNDRHYCLKGCIWQALAGEERAASATQAAAVVAIMAVKMW